MNNSSRNWVTILSLGSAFCALLVMIANVNALPQFAGILALTSVLLAVIAAPMSFKKSTQYVRVRTRDDRS